MGNNPIAPEQLPTAYVRLREQYAKNKISMDLFITRVQYLLDNDLMETYTPVLYERPDNPNLIESIEVK